MKSLARNAGQPRSEKRSTQDSAAKYWGMLGKEKPFKRNDGSIGVDKTRGWHSRTKFKETIRNANRAITKRARQILKRQMLGEATEV